MLEFSFAAFFTILAVLIVFFAYKLMYAFSHFRMKQLLSAPAMLHDLPSVSVCIPARNEVHAMTQCLERVIASTYPKLEIIVLDDSSRDNTSVLIKSFAHAGVRFVEGSKLPEGWLGKNHALDGLLKEASGSYILYMDVDTLVEPDTIGQLVSYAQQENALMVSVLPRRIDRWRTSIFFTTLRYFRELILHRRSSPAVASSAWMIHRHTLRDELNGFDQYKDHIQPEAQFAARLMRQSKYRFLMSTPLLGVSYEKKWLSQVETDIRLTFPIFGGRVITNSIAFLLLLMISSLPLIFVSGFFVGWSMIHVAALLQLCLFMVLYGLFLSRVWKYGWWIGALLWPFVIIQESVITWLSAVAYLRGTVTWKGRSIVAAKRINS